MLKQVGPYQLAYFMAASQEYGAELQKRFTPFWTGVGPVEAAIATTAILSQHRPSLAICLGSAGSANLQQAEVYQASSVTYRDMDASPLGFEKGRTPFLDLPAELSLPLRIDGPRFGRLSTGANIVSGDAYAQIDADMVDMETFAVLRACQRFNVPLIGLRGISDGKEDLAVFEDWTQYLGIIDVKLAQVVDALESQLLEGTIVL